MLKRIYEFYSGDLTSKDLENTLFKETPERYKYYLKEIEKSGQTDGKNTGIYSSVKIFIKAFLIRLSPVIRIAYSLAVLIFIVAWIQEDWQIAILAFLIVNLILIYEIAEKLTAGDELKVAKDVQMSLLPKDPPSDPNFDFAYHYETAKVVGGDFIDFIKKNENVYFISTGDISGKGMSAALYMIQVRLLIRQLSDFYDNPGVILSEVNKNIFKHIRRGLYFSSILAEVRDRNIKICRAGHNPVLIYENANGQCREIKQNGMAVGLCNNDMFANSMEEYDLSIKSGDIVLFYSDGLTECMNSRKEEFGLDRIKKILCENSYRTSEEIKNTFLTEINKFRGYAEIHDDITLIIMKAV
ncbi:MAG: PP2C family protein-serine/threonine phosphatase [Bacteroidetes bacterium]|nr:PP2C family protein-serine/threonine phosphatase [Bacteroidota bacterium]